MLNLENHTPSFGEGRYVRKHIGKQFCLFWLPGGYIYPRVGWVYW
jgi:hypothetical protein